MANEQIKVPLYAASEILTAANMNISAGTGVPVFATTVTRDAAFGGAGEKVLAEGQLCYLSSTNVVQYYDGAAWATVGPATAGGLTLISATTIGTTVASVTISSAFSATYDNYLISISGGVASTDVGLRLTLGATATGYYYGGFFVRYSGGSSSFLSQSNNSYLEVGYGTTNGFNTKIELDSPNLTKRTFSRAAGAGAGTTTYMNYLAGFLDNATSYTAFTFTLDTGTMTGGTIRVYGYLNS